MVTSLTIRRDVCNLFNVTMIELLGTTRQKSVVRARHTAIYLIRKRLNYSFNQIGKIFNRDHKTIMHGYRKIEKEIKFLHLSSSGKDPLKGFGLWYGD